MATRKYLQEFPQKGLAVYFYRELADFLADNDPSVSCGISHSDNRMTAKRLDYINWFRTKRGWSPQDWNETERLLKEGWAEGREKGRKALEDLKMARLPSLRKKVFWGEQGSQIDMRKVYQGQLNRAWKQLRPVDTDSLKRRGQAVTILVNIGANCGTDADDMFWAGATASWMVEALEESGRTVRVVCYGKSVNNLTSGTCKDTAWAIVLKEYGEEVDYNNLWFTTANAGFFRRYVFELYGRSPLGTVAEGLGQSTSISGNEFSHEMDMSGEGSEVVIHLGSVFSKNSAIHKIDELKRLVGDEEEK